MASDPADDRRKALNLAIAQIEKTCGKGSIMRMGSERARVKVDAIQTGAINPDAAIGGGGIPRGRVSEIFGPESSGKTPLALHSVSKAVDDGCGSRAPRQRGGRKALSGVSAGVDVDNL